MEWADVAERLDRSGLKANPPIAGHWRLVTHRDVDSADVARLLEALG